jgi:hypothetical protein
MLKFLPIFLVVAVNLSAVSVYFEKTPTGCRIAHHRIEGRQGAAIEHAPQDPGKFPGRGNKKQQRENQRNGH